MLALIPARGGSKGLPGKNIKLLHQQPLIAYSIAAALECPSVTRVIVSTDNAEIAQIAQKYGAEVPFLRPQHLATDTSTSLETYLFTLSELEKTENYPCEDILILQPTSPLRTALHIQEAIELFKAKNADSVVSYCQEHHPIFWHKYVNENGQFAEVFNEGNIQNRQELKPTYYPNGAIYIFKTQLLKQGIYYTENSYAYLMDKKFSVDIDTEEDFEFASYLIEKQHQR